MARVPIMAAGGIVLRREQPPRIAVVRLRKRDEWVLPKGKLDDGETPRDAAKREVLEETGHKVTVHEFLGTLVYDTGARSKVVHYWRMEALDEPLQPLMDDVRAVDWLPLDAAVERLSRDHEKTFLETVGPYALAGLIRKTRAKPLPAAKTKDSVEKPATARKRRSRVTEQPAPVLEDVPAVEAIASEDTSGAIAPAAAAGPAEVEALQPVDTALRDDGAAEPVPTATAEPVPEHSADVERVEAVAAAIKSLVPLTAPDADALEKRDDPPSDLPNPDAGAAPPEEQAAAAIDPPEDGPRRSLAQKMRAWLGRAA
ncbi:NUDIX domain-containing protein [Bradyrhizobium oligotrophicum]|uniref:NUDIX hydrolase n=1 Tax=Bradyrhizobium oligotrophicum TaxID=44255 RepID=UPI003EB933D9